MWLPLLSYHTTHTHILRATVMQTKMYFFCHVFKHVHTDVLISFHVFYVADLTSKVTR